MAKARLSAAFCRTVKRPGRYGDGHGGNGLSLLVTKPSDTARERAAKRGEEPPAFAGKYWTQRLTIRGKRRDLGLGSYEFMSLAEAREAAFENRKAARRGGDPLAERRRTSTVPTFADAMEAVVEIRGGGWSPAVLRKWRQQMERHAIPALGGVRVDAIQTEDVLRVVSPHWHERPKMAREVRQRIGLVMAWAVAQKYRADNPADAALAALPKQRKPVEHHAALPFADVPATLEAIRADDTHAGTRLALRFLILTAARTGEVRLARWDEVDFGARAWTIPAERMKARREHVVPLSDAALDVLREAGAERRNEFVFPGSQGPAASNMAVNRLVKRLGIAGTVHGFRSTFRDWAGERSGAPREIAELCLAHAVGSSVERAYSRSDLRDKRRDLMERWGAFCTARPGDVVKLHA